MIGRAEDLRDGPGFHNLTTIHHAHAVGDFSDDTNVVGDDDDAEIPLTTEFLDQVKDLFLDGHIQRRCRLIRDDQIGVARQSEGDHNALAHAAGKLVRIGFQPGAGLGDADSLQQLNRAIIGLRAFDAGRLFNRLNQLRTDSQQRVQRGLWILKDHPDPVAPNLAHLILCAPAQFFPFEHD